MVIMRLEDLALEDGVEHLATDWQISNREDFANIVLQAKKDDVNKTSIVFSETLDPTRKWYGRARVLLTTGYTIWGNLEVFTTDQNDSLETLTDLPSRISVPQVTTTSNKDNHDVTLFDIKATGFEVVGNSTHYATSWIIEDIEGKVQWSSLTNSIYKDFILVHDIILDANAVYRIKVIFHGSSGDMSPIATYTIRTGDNSDVHLLTYLDEVDPEESIDLEMNQLDGAEEVTWKVYGFINDIAYKLWEVTLGDNNYTKTSIPIDTLKLDDIYLLEITPTSDTIRSKFIPFRTKSTSSNYKPQLPTVSFVPSETIVEMKRNTEKEITYESDADFLNFTLENNLAATITHNADEKKLIIKSFDNQIEIDTKIIISGYKEGYENYIGSISVFISDLDKVEFTVSTENIELTKDFREATFTVEIPEDATVECSNDKQDYFFTLEQVKDATNTWKVVGNIFNRKGNNNVNVIVRQPGKATTVKFVNVSVPNSLYKYSCKKCGWSTDSDMGNCYNRNIKYPLGVKYIYVYGKYERYGCGGCNTIFCNFSEVEGAPYGSQQQFFYNANWCPNMWVWYGSNSQYNFTQES